MKSAKGNKQWHVPNTKIGTGDFYGTGVKNKVGRSIYNSMEPKMGNQKLGKPPKSLA